MTMDNTPVRGLYGSAISKTKAVAFCKHHKAHLTENTLKGHKCLGKQCRYLKKHEEHSYWSKRDILKILKKQNKPLGGYYV